MRTLVASYSRAGLNCGNGGAIDLPKGNAEVLTEAIVANVAEGLSIRGTDAVRSTDKAVAWAKKAIA